ncbi:hypothetical protein SS1G_09105 [Sclerotinia sclerotiorum 1980 UF-70]|uniref:Peptidase A1 domain-containing protein n=1 Tax=Sclerotinia sclerotiorum (strain ATCC 18683 / 1980 / Ss-1) TaxID=665079 RepID=A7EUU7_SCLS1|nr:hypothetical protein SS1G_09105 [Sclerotinia sclerotiorum 1980 UF-70]EDN93239.1 hypothetical protein SS1G_09105 [Sclerotinia sclerotiorum 1980 UF-70]
MCRVPLFFVKSLTVGTPAQNIVVLPWAELNNTWLYDYDALCDTSIIFDDTICRVRRGNFFYENGSTTYDKGSNMVAVGGATIETAGYGAETGIADLMTTSLAGSDTFSPGATNLSNFPIGIPRQNWDHGYTILHAMGMGKNSTYLNSLVETGKIASKVWSIFWGRMWIDQPLDGQVVIGGYDQEKVIGQNYTQALDYSDTTGCWTGMKVTISDIELIDRTGSTTSIFPPNFALPVCIVPQRQLLIEAPGSIFDTFQNETNTQTTGVSYGLHWLAQLYDTTNYFQGDMSIKLSSGLQVTIPNSQFMPPFVTIDRNGSRIFNESEREFLYGVTSNQPSTLGRYFLTAAYLMINHDENTFTLWQANPSTATDLVPTISKDTAESCANVTTNGTVVVNGTVTTEPGTSSSTTAATTNTNTQTGLSPGALAGIVVGILAVVAIIAGICLYMFRKKKQSPRNSEVALAPIPAFVPDSTFAGFYEVHGTQSKHEMDASRRTYEYGYRDEPVQELA